MKDEVFETIKARVTLRSVMERDGAVFRRAGAALVCCCPIHGEKTPSCHLHESERGDWFRCFGCDARGDIFSYVQAAHQTDVAGALKLLKPLAGLGDGAGEWVPPKREAVPVAEEEPVVALDEAEGAKWRAACAGLRADEKDMARIAAWRGLSEDLVAWAAEQELMGRVTYRGVWREAFLIERPAEGGGAERIGWHVRLAPHTAGNEHDRASWRYQPRKGLGAWPFVISPTGPLAEARYLFILEGQWDALALVELFGWHRKWPKGVAVVGVRGATSWERLLAYELDERATAFLIGDADKAGEGWFVPRPGRRGELTFSEALGRRVRRVWAWRPNPAWGKDFNDVVKAASPQMRECIVAQLRRFQRTKRKPKRGRTFLQYAKLKVNRAKVALLLEELKGRTLPAARAPKKRWRALVESLSPEARRQWEAMWSEWEALNE